MLIKKIVAILCVALLFSSCAEKPSATQKNGVTKAETQSDKSVESALNNDDDSAKENILANIPKEYKTSFQGKMNKLIIDAVVNIPPVTEDILTYQIDKTTLSEEQTNSIAKSFWGEKSSELEWDERSHIYTMDKSKNPNSYYTYVIRDGRFVISFKGADYNPYPENRVIDEKDYKGNLKTSEAISACEKILSNMDTNTYKVSNVTMYGQGGNHPYMDINFAYYKNGMPIFSRSSLTYTNFIVDDDGIGRMIGYGFSLQEQEPVSKIIPLETAIELLTESIDNIAVFGNGEFDNNQIDESGNLTEMNVCEITFQYSIRKALDGKMIASPSWGFWLKKSSTNSKTNVFVAIDAITGEVII